MTFCLHPAWVRCQNCSQTQQYGWAYPYQPIFKCGQKCDLCGSTAVDHTEQLCKLNRLSVEPKPTKEEDV